MPALIMFPIRRCQLFSEYIHYSRRASQDLARISQEDSTLHCGTEPPFVFPMPEDPVIPFFKEYPDYCEQYDLV